MITNAFGRGVQKRLSLEQERASSDLGRAEEREEACRRSAAHLEAALAGVTRALEALASAAADTPAAASEKDSSQALSLATETSPLPPPPPSTCTARSQTPSEEAALESPAQAKARAAAPTDEWVQDPSVWVRRCQLAATAGSPRWRAALLSEIDRWRSSSAPMPLRPRQPTAADRDVATAEGMARAKAKSEATPLDGLAKRGAGAGGMDRREPRRPVTEEACRGPGAARELQRRLAGWDRHPSRSTDERARAATAAAAAARGPGSFAALCGDVRAAWDSERLARLRCLEPAAPAAAGDAQPGSPGQDFRGMLREKGLASNMVRRPRRGRLTRAGACRPRPPTHSPFISPT